MDLLPGVFTLLTLTIGFILAYPGCVAQYTVAVCSHPAGSLFRSPSACTTWSGYTTGTEDLKIYTSYVAERKGEGSQDLLRWFDSIRNCIASVQLSYLNLRVMFLHRLQFIT